MADFTTIKDANGKEFSIDLSHIADLNGDVTPETSIKDSKRNRIMFQHDARYVDSKGEDIDTNKLVNDIKTGKVNVAALDVTFEATHSGKNHNYCIYYSDSMEKDSESFTNPFSKPLLKNHDSYCEPIGRIRKAVHSDSVLTDERTTIKVTARVTDEDAMLKFIDKRYQTVSIGGSMGTVTCNICGKTILKDGKFKFCGHWKGETYKDQICYWGARDIDYNELSVVNNPADDYAQVISVTVLTDKDLENPDRTNDNKKEEKTMDGENTNTTQSKDEIRTKVFDFIDSLLASNSSTTVEATTSDAETQTETSKVTDTNSEDTNANTIDSNDSSAANTTDIAENQDNVSSEENTAEDTLKAELETAKDSLNEANEKIASLETNLTAKDEEINQLKQQLEDSKNDSEAIKNQMIEIAKQNKSLVADAIIAKEIATRTLDEEKVEERKTELSDKSMKELGELLDKVSTLKATRREPAHVDNPTVPINDSNSNKSADTNDSQKETRKTVNDFASSIIEKLPV